MKIWMKVTQDEFELPLAVANTSYELAKICGTTANNVRSTVAKGKSGIIKNPSFVMVEVKEGETDEC